MRISDWSSDVCSSDLEGYLAFQLVGQEAVVGIEMRDARAARQLHGIVNRRIGAAILLERPKGNTRIALARADLAAVVAGTVIGADQLEIRHRLRTNAFDRRADIPHFISQNKRRVSQACVRFYVS